MEKVAIIGISCLFPGAETPEQFWKNLIERKDSTSEATKEQMGVDPAIFYNPKIGEKDRYYCLKGGFIRDFQFDPTGYRLPRESIASLDDLFKWSLYVAKEALEDSGYSNDESILARCGVILGTLSTPTKWSHHLVSPIYRKTVGRAVGELLQAPDFQLQNLSAPEDISLFNILTAGYPSAIVARALSLGGIHFAIDAACSSALYAIELACQYLLCGKTDLMLAGAICCTDPLFTHMIFSILQAYPSDGNSRPLDSSSQGLLTGEGAGMVALKRYSDALRDGDKIHATIEGIGLSNDGKGKYVVSPNPKGQILAFERAYAEAGIDPKDIEYIECHATGTDLGDKTELGSMNAFLSRYDATPAIGSVKSNLGHLLTAAGMPSIIKAISSMSAGIIPPTIGITAPLFGKDSIVRSAIPWPSRGNKKLAAVSAFGFGGTNAHMILGKGDIPQKSSPPSPTPPSPIAIVGMDAFFGCCDGLDAFERGIYEAKQHFIPLPLERWKGIENEKQLLIDYGFANGQAPKGAYIKDFEIDFLNFKIPPKPTEQPLAQQLLILKVADRALKDAGMRAGGNVAAIVAMEMDASIHLYRARCDSEWQLLAGLKESQISLPNKERFELSRLIKESLHEEPEVSRLIGYIGNIMACRISSLWDFSGPSFTLSARENSVFKALEVAQMLLDSQKVDAVVVGAVDLAGGVENVLLRHQIAKISTGEPTLSFDRDADGWLVGEGAGAVVLKRSDKAKQDGDRVYATIDAISLVGEKQSPDQNPVALACLEAFSKAGVSAKDIGYLEVFASGIPTQDDAEIEGLLRAYRSDRNELSCAIGSVKANIGNAFAASGMASLIKTALCLHRGYIPGVPDWSAPKRPEIWQGSPFYVPNFSRLWTVGKETPKKFAAINGSGLDGTCAHIILSEAGGPKQYDTKYLQQTLSYLFPLAGEDKEAILEGSSALEEKIALGANLAEVAHSCFRAFSSSRTCKYALVILGSTKEELIQEIERARLGIKWAFDRHGEWRTPLGSYFTANPLGKKGKVAFVYPGTFTTYIGMGRDLFRLFPKTHETIERYSSTERAKESIHLSNILYYPRSLEKLSKRQLEILEGELLDRASMMLVSGIISVVVNTAIMRDYFQIEPRAAFGYSLGEFSMMFGLEVWTRTEDIARSFESSDLFVNQLAGAMNAVRSYWGLPLTQQPADSEFWSSYVLLASPQAIRENLKPKDRIYITHINTPTEVVIAGDKQSCLRLIEQLRCNYIIAPSSQVLHCPPMHSKLNEFVQLFSLPIERVPEIDVYSAANYTRMKLEEKAIASSIAKVMCEAVDFPRLVNRVYEDGARIFIELGGGGITSRWIAETLKDKEHLATSSNIKGIDDRKVIVRLLAQLVSHGVDVDLSPLYSLPETAPPQPKSLVKTVTLGGCNIRSTILAASSKFNIQKSPSSPTRTIFNEAGVLEFATGSLVKVLGEEYEKIDTLPRRTRLPMPPYLFISRVTRIEPKPGVYFPATIETEYDIPRDAWYAIGDRLPSAIILEACHGNMLLMICQGIDFETKGQKVCRALGGTMTYFDRLPIPGETIRTKVQITSFSRSGNILVYYFTCEYFVGERKFLEIKSEAGFFSDEQLKQAKGVSVTKLELLEKSKIQKQHFEPLLSCSKSSFELEDLLHLCKRTVNLAACFGDGYDSKGKNPMLGLPPFPILMLDRVTSVDPSGGAWGLGLLVAEKELEPEHWYFNCHFQNDFCLPGTLMSESCIQLLQFYILYLGLHARMSNATFAPIPNLVQTGKYRGQIEPASAKLTCEIEVKEIGIVPNPFAIAEARVIYKERTIATMKNIGIQLSEKNF